MKIHSALEAGGRVVKKETVTSWDRFQAQSIWGIPVQVGLTWSDSRRFILDSVKHRLNENHPLWQEAVRKAARNCKDEIEAEQLIEALTKASRTATCRAHHVANAITSYRAAFLRTSDIFLRSRNFDTSS